MEEIGKIYTWIIDKMCKKCEMDPWTINTICTRSKMDTWAIDKICKVGKIDIIVIIGKMCKMDKWINGLINKWLSYRPTLLYSR